MIRQDAIKENSIETLAIVSEISSSRPLTKTEWKTILYIAVMSMNGIEDIYIHEGNVNGDAFKDFVRRCLIPIVMPYDSRNPNCIVIMNNASIHKTQATRYKNISECYVSKNGTKKHTNKCAGGSTKQKQSLVS